MGYTVNTLLNVARSQLGYHEKGSNANLDSFDDNSGNSNYTKYARDLNNANYYQANKQSFEWCDMFVDWCHLQAANGNANEAQRVICQSGPYGAACVNSAQYYKNFNRLFYSNPQPGDQIFFGDYDHTGIVEAVNGKTITVIEGNSHNCVERNNYNIDDSWVKSFGRPFYDEEKVEILDEEEEIMYNTLAEVPDYAKPTIQKLINKGYLKGNADGSLGLTNSMIRIFVIHDRAGLYD